jgi:asparagine synthase (glutamine-hydrolysing)
MSVIFGACVSPNSIVDKESLFRVADATTRYGMDETKIHTQGRIGMGFQAFHTHHRSRLEQQPAVHALGNVLVFDGRLDNHRDLSARLDLKSNDVADSVLILEAFARWGEDCFAYLVGDWALALWSASDQALYLARDHAGTRTLFYRNQNSGTRWSTYLESFFLDDRSPELDHEYIARVISSQEIRDLTPYKDIQAVLPAHYIVIREGLVTIRPHWCWIANTTITYKREAEYDEHFFCIFRQAVQRRIGTGAPILAELSGGMDSASIVCMADKILRNQSDGSDLLDTISYYDDTEPDWDERPFFEAVEQYRNKRGIHLDCSERIPSYEPLVLPDRIYPYPGTERLSLDIANQFELSVGRGRYRVILSGVGGDELLGGVPTPMPELADYLWEGKLFTLFLKAVEWCKVSRRPLFHMLRETIAFTSHLYQAPSVDADTIPPWLSLDLRRVCLRFRGRERETSRLTTIPSAINNGRIWWNVLETLPHLAPALLGCYEYRYPYLDRDLVEFLHRIPREELVRPGRRRLLMRRSLREIVPIAILERKRKAYISHGPIAKLRDAREKLDKLFLNPLIAAYGFIDQSRFSFALQAALLGDLKWVAAIGNTIGIELWLQSAKKSNMDLRTDSDRENFKRDLPVIHRGKGIHAGFA